MNGLLGRIERMRRKDFLSKEVWKTSLNDAKKGRENKRGHIPFRLNFLFFIIFVLFVALILRLGNLQIVNSDKWEKEIKSATVTTVKQSTPRGSIYDATGKVLATNQANAAITFTRTNDMSATDMLALAKELNQLIEMPADENLNPRDLKDYYLADKKHLEAAQKKLSTKDQLKSSSEQYQAMIDQIDDDQLKFDENELKIATIFTRLNSGQNLKPVFVKNKDVTNEELAIVAENASKLPGISTGTDWDREVVTASNPLASIIGRVSTSKQGLPSEEAEEYLKKGYFSNDRVGTSFLEKQYEDQLQGKKSEYEVTIDNNGTISNTKELSAGSKGDNLKLTIDEAFQDKFDEIVKNGYQELINSGDAEFSNGIYAVAMNPKTGAILGVSGYYHEEGSSEIQDDAIGTFVGRQFEPGSAIKAATITTGFDHDVITPENNTIYDQPIYLAGSPAKASVFNPYGSNNRYIDAAQALEISSNSYMMQIALRLLGIDYKGGSLQIPGLADQKTAYEQLREGFAQYGLGVKTGVDMPEEAVGGQVAYNELSDANFDGGKVLDLAFGQFDTYTPIQLAQYVSAIANGGERVAPHFVEGIYDNNENGDLGTLQKAIEKKVLNKIDITPEEMAIIQQGMHDVVHGNDPFTTARPLATAKMDLSAKTGTAEAYAYKDGQEIPVNNLNAVVYGPTEDPEIAVSIMIPRIKQSNHSYPNLSITKDIMDAYYDMYLAK